MESVPCSRCGNPVRPNAFTCAACGVFRPGRRASEDGPDASPALVCTRCGHHGPAVVRAKGSGWIEVVLYLTLLLPGVLYSLWRRTDLAPRCAACGSTEVVPESSPVGAEILARAHG